MRRTSKKAFCFIIFLFLMPTFMSILDVNQNDINQDNKLSVIIPPDKELDVKSSAPDPLIHVDANWTWTVGNGTATGLGTWADPYIIQDKVIDGGQADYGIRIDNTFNYCFRIENCTIYNCKSGGIYFGNVNNGTIIDCNVSNNDDGVPTNNIGNGIWMSGCDNNTIINNILFNNSEYGIYMGSSDDNVIQGNLIANNSRHGVCFITSSYRNELIDNKIVNNSFFGLSSSNGNDHIIKGNLVSDNLNDGLRFYGGNGCNITENIIQRNEHGVEIEWTSTNFVVFKNSFIGNVLHAYDGVGGNEFNSATIGNYWENYTGNDNSPLDGIGDIPYNFIGGGHGAIDNFPIYQNPMHTGEKIRIDEKGVNAFNWSQTALIKNWISGNGSYTNPYIIEDLEIDCVGTTNGIHIENSNEMYFTIRHCRATNSGTSTRNGGIYIFNSTRGFITENNCSYNNENGISLYQSYNITISDNIANHNTEKGILITGIVSNPCYNITIEENNLDFNDFGVYIWFGDNSDIIGNNASNCTTDGIILYICRNNTIIGNTFNNNSRHGIYSYQNYGGHIIRNNTANNNTGYGIGLDGSGTGTNDNNNVSENVVYGNTGLAGIFLNRADKNLIYNNLIQFNPQRGIYIGGSSYDNTIYNNTFKGNSLHAQELVTTGMNYWNSTVTGNYWDNYTGLDSNGDGFGDDPYVIRESPLRQDEMPIWTYSGQISIDGTATGVGAHNWTWAASQSWCTGSGTYEDPYVISGVYLNVDNTGNCLEIQDSSVYFRVQDCVFKNAGTGTGIYLFDVNNSTFKNNLIINNKNGITLGSCTNNSFIRNNITLSAQTGIEIDSSINNDFTLNEITNNINYGVTIGDILCGGNIFHKNAFLNNGIHALDDSSPNSNFWNNSIIGNYWDNHSTGDADLNGIDNTQFNGIAGVAGAIDYLPIYGDPRHDGLAISIDDSVIGNNWQYHSTRFWCSGSGTWSNPYILEDLTIDGEGSNTGIEIQVSEMVYFTIRGCIILNTAYDGGIYLFSSWNARIINNYIVDSDEKGIYLDECHNFTVSNNFISETAESGIYMLTSYDNIINDNQIQTATSLGGIRLNGCENNTISGNYVNNTLSNNGIWIYDCESNNITDNIIENTLSESGIGISSDSYFNIIRNNSVSYSFSEGIYIESCGNNYMIDNVLFLNKNGIFVNNSNNCTFIGNNAHNNSQDGIKLTYSDGCIFNDNTAIYNGESGIMLGVCDFTELIGNTLSRNNVSGLEVYGCLYTQITNNAESFNNNIYFGIYLINTNQSTISGNVANNNYIGIYLNFAHNNIISGNTFLGNTLWKLVTANSTGNVFTNNNYGQDNGEEPTEPPMDLMTIIIIAAIIGAVAIGGFVIVKQRGSKEKTAKSKEKTDQKVKIKVKQKEAITPPVLPKGPKKDLKDKIEFEEKVRELTAEEKADLEKTEKEVDVEKQKFICVVHKGPIEADNIYLCPNCQTFYCMNCAKVLKTKGEKCWSCESEIKITIQEPKEPSQPSESETPEDILKEEALKEEPLESESSDIISSEEKKILERADAIKKFDEYIEQLNSMVQKLDIKFSAGTITQEQYIEKKTELAEKLGEAMAKRDQLAE